MTSLVRHTISNSRRSIMRRETTSYMRTVRAAAFVGSVVAAAIPTARAEGQATPPVIYWACYVPTTGTTYRIKTADTRDKCAASSHVEFSWNQVGPQGPQGPQGPAGPQGAQG